MSRGALAAGLLGSLLLAVLTWGLLDQFQKQTLTELTRAEAAASTRTVERDLTLRLNRLSSLGRKVLKGGEVDAALFEAKAQQLRDLYGGTVAVAFVGTDQRIRAMSPQSASLTVGRKVDGISKEGAAILRLAAASEEPVISQPLSMFGSGPMGMALVAPVFHNDEHVGFLGAALHTDQWIENLLFGVTSPGATRNYAKTIYIGGEPAFVTDDFGRVRAPVIASPELALFNTSVRTELQARPGQILGLGGWLPEAIGLTLASFGFLCVFALAQVTRARRAESVARQAQSATAQFLATMSHEVRTPLNAIMGMFELIERAEVTPRITRQAQAGRSAALRLFAELTNVLDASRLDAGALAVHKSVEPLAPLIERWTETLEALVERGDAGVAARVTATPPLPDTVLVDPERTTKILNNLFDNAVKFTRDGEVALTIAAHGPDLVLRVSDTGIGIPDAQAAQIFERFYQIEDVRMRSFQGAGLGLAICRELAQLMGATLDLEKTVPDVAGGAEPSGTTFCLVLKDAVIGDETDLDTRNWGT